MNTLSLSREGAAELMIAVTDRIGELRRRQLRYQSDLERCEQKTDTVMTQITRERMANNNAKLDALRDIEEALVEIIEEYDEEYERREENEHKSAKVSHRRIRL